MDECKVSIIVGVYNSENFLKKGLDSLVNQTWKNLEIILVDDGSTDNSGKICDQYGTLDERMIIVHKKNGGVCESRNLGLSIATGDYVCFMDGDDWFSCDFVEYMMNIINTTGCAMAFSDKLFTTRDREQVKNDRIEIYDSEKAIVNIIYPYMILGPWNKMYSMSLIKKHNISFPSHWFGETLHFANAVAYYSGKVGVGHRKVYNYRLNNSNSGTTVYNVNNRLLSLDNVLRLPDTVFYNTKRIKNAVSWHTFDNYNILIMDIVGSNNIDGYRKEFNAAKKYLRNNLLKVFFTAEIDIKRRLMLIFETFFPLIVARHRIKKKNKALKCDIDY